MDEKPRILELSYDVLRMVFQHLSIIDLLACERTNLLWCGYLRDIGFWKQYCLASDQSTTRTQLQKRKLSKQLRQVVPWLPQEKAYPAVFQEVTGIYRYFKIDFNQLEKGLGSINLALEELKKRAILADNTHLRLLAFMRHYLCHPSIPTFEHACQKMIKTMTDGVGMLMIILFAEHREKCLPIFENVCHHLNIGYDQFYIILRQHYQEISPYRGENPEDYFENTMMWMQTIPFSPEAERWARKIIEDECQNLDFDYVI